MSFNVQILMRDEYQIDHDHPYNEPLTKWDKKGYSYQIFYEKASLIRNSNWKSIISLIMKMFCLFICFS